MAATLEQAELDRLRSSAEQASRDYVDDLKRLVDIDSGSHTKAGVDLVVDWAAERLGRLGGSVQRRANQEFGDTIVASFGQTGAGPAVLMVAHADTVFDAGTAAARPFRIDGDRAFGPGVYDMKGGLLLGLGALAVVGDAADDGRLPVGRLDFVVNPDEEIGSPTSSATIRDLATEADAALVLEGARPNGAIVTARAGMMHIRITLNGRAAHAGVEPLKGRSAILEAAHKVVALHALNDHARGVSVNVGVIHGGTRANVVAAEATLTVDLRARWRSDQEEAAAAIRDIAKVSTVPDVSSSVETLALHWPMEPSEGSRQLLDLAAPLASGLGFELEGVAAGGASDANTTSASGAPTLDGLGPIGGDAHAPGEYLVLSSVVPRMTFLAALLTAIGRGGQPG